MKKIYPRLARACFSILMALITTAITGQSPESFNYQAILRYATGAVGR